MKVRSADVVLPNDVLDLFLYRDCIVQETLEGLCFLGFVWFVCSMVLKCF